MSSSANSISNKAQFPNLTLTIVEVKVLNSSCLFFASRSFNGPRTKIHIIKQNVFGGVWVGGWMDGWRRGMEKRAATGARFHPLRFFLFHPFSDTKDRTFHLSIVRRNPVTRKNLRELGFLLVFMLRKITCYRECLWGVINCIVK